MEYVLQMVIVVGDCCGCVVGCWDEGGHCCCCGGGVGGGFGGFAFFIKVVMLLFLRFYGDRCHFFRLACWNISRTRPKQR